MEKSDFIVPQSIYKKHLSEIGGVKFTPREISLIACFISGRSAKTIASFLSISPKTVEAHSRNIMLKLGCNSKEGVISFVEKSGKYKSMKDYYAALLSDISFKKILGEIKPSLLQIEQAIIFYKENDSSLYLKKLQEDILNLGNKVSLKKQGRPDAPHNGILVELTDQHILIQGEAFSYYDGVFEILKKVYPNVSFGPFIDKFHLSAKNLDTLLHESENEKSEGKTNFRLGKASFFVLFVLLLSIGGGALYVSISPPDNRLLIRSDLLIPHEEVLLERSKLLNLIEEKLKSQRNIRSVALVGIGGAGKTTLARQFAKQHQGAVIWELNAETHGSLLESFELLAYKLCETDKEKQLLKELQLITKTREREDKIILFVRDRLKLHPNWCLIFDNVERFTDIQNFFPRDEGTWGKGIVIVTTRDGTIQNNKYIKQTVVLGDLDSKQKYSLFSRILGLPDESSLDHREAKEVGDFLKEIPSFPLDVSVAAYYLKETGTSYKNYLKKIKENQKGFNAVQEEILKESGEYLNTRYKIISLALDKLIDTHKEFRDLLLFMSFLDSQNIPFNLLKKVEDESLVDAFIFHLKKLSLITNISLEASNPTLSIHRSTQAIAFDYLANHQQLLNQPELINKISKAFDDYLANALDEDDLLKIKNHCEAFLDHSKALPVIPQSIAKAALGAVYFYLGDYAKTKMYLEDNIKAIKGSDKLTRSVIARSLAYLGTTYRIEGNYNKALECLKQSLGIYRTYISDNQAKIAWILAQIGIVYREKGRYTEAEEYIKRGKSIYEKILNKDHTKVAWALATLATVYIETGKLEQAKLFLEKSLLSYQREYSENHIRVAWVIAHLGFANYELGNFAKARELLEKALLVYQEYFFDHHIEIVRALRYLGNTHRALGDTQKAKICLEKSIALAQESFSNNHTSVGLGFLGLADVNIVEEENEKAGEFLSYAKDILETKNHSALYMVFERQGDILLAKSNKIKAAQRKGEEIAYHKEALGLFEKAIKILEASYPEGCHFLKKLNLKVKKLKQSFRVNDSASTIPQLHQGQTL